MSSKHLINEPRTIVIDSLKGLVALNPNVRLNESEKVIHLSSISKNQVALISGGGSGHEPSHAGFVGKGLLSAAVCGNVFASPNVKQITKSLEICENEKGILIVIMQYTGDVLHFGLALEQFRAKHPKSNVRLIYVGDDVSVGREQGKMVGRRGMAGTVLCYKLGGALAAKGADIDAVFDISKFVADRTATVGAGLDHCHIPGTAAASSHLKENEVEKGMGIHNEPGMEVDTLTTSKKLLEDLIGMATDTTDKDRSFVPFGNDGKDEVVLMINNLGGISELELGGLVGTSMDILAERKIKVRRVLSGTYMTSLNMPGFSISLFLLPRPDDSASPYKTDELLDLIDSDGDAPGWKWHAKGEPGVHASSSKKEKEEEVKVEAEGDAIAPVSSKAFISAIKQACEDVIGAEKLITEYDTIAGDGDCGLCLKAGGEGILKAVADGRVSDSDVVSAILTIAEQIEIDMDGTSGALYSIFFNALARGIRSAADSQSTKTADAKVWAEAFSLAKDSFYNYTRARSPSRTLVDPLEAFVTAFVSSPSDFAAAVKAGVDAAAATKDYEAKAGRAAYVGREQLKAASVPDPGAHGVGVLLQGVQKALGA